MARWIAAFVLAASVVVGAGAPPAGKILIAGDSTSADFGKGYWITGWGVPLKCRVTAQVVDLARGGRTAKAFADEGLWEKLRAQVEPGDVVLIQFGTNDGFQKLDPDRQYGPYLEGFARDVTAAKGRPIILSPVARLTYSGSRLDDAHAPYTVAARAAAARSGADFIDLDAKSMALINQQGQAASQRMYQPDRTHFTQQGAALIADLIARALADRGLATRVEDTAACDNR